MGLKIKSFGGRVGFEARRYLGSVPILVNIETINRCNGHYSFCPCNVDYETRPFRYMENDLFEKIISDLKNLKYNGVITLHVNNEPFMDKLMVERLSFAKKHLPLAYFLLYSNGTLLTAEDLNKLRFIVDRLIINSYNKSYELTKS